MTITVDVDRTHVVYRCVVCGAQYVDDPAGPPERGRAFLLEHMQCRRGAGSADG